MARPPRSIPTTAAINAKHIKAMLTQDQQESHDSITGSLEQCEVWLLGEPDTETAKTHLLDALDEMNYQLQQLEI